MCDHHLLVKCFTWWRQQMETFSALMAICAGNSPVPGEFPTQRPVARSFDVFFDLRLNKRLSKQSWGWWFETPSHPLWRHHNGSLAAHIATSRFEWNGQHIAGDIFQNWTFLIYCKILPMFILGGQSAKFTLCPISGYKWSDSNSMCDQICIVWRYLLKWPCHVWTIL